MFDLLNSFSEKASSFRYAVNNESQTRTVLIEPLIRILGYDTSNPFEVVPEYTCDVGTKKGEKVDYALLKDNDISILVEAKDSRLKLTDKNISQLFRYFSVSSARVAILTNGIDYWFFTDTIKQNVMDSEPFFIFNIFDFNVNDAEFLCMFSKDNFNVELIRRFAISSSFKNSFVEYFSQQAKSPTNDFVSFIMKNIGMSNINSTDATNLVSSGLASLLRDPIFLEDSVSVESTVSGQTPIKTMDSRYPDRPVGIFSLEDLTSKNCKGTKPVEVMIGGFRGEVNGWSDVLLSVFSYCSSVNIQVDFFTSLGTDGVLPYWMSFDEKSLRRPKETSYEGLFVDVNYSSKDILKKIQHFCTELKLSSSDFLIELI